MEINILFDPSGRFVVDKSDDMGTFVAVGMLEMAKAILQKPALEEGKPTTEEEKELEGQVGLDEV